MRPRDASLAFNLGLLLAERGKSGEAEQALRSALEADPHLGSRGPFVASIGWPRLWGSQHREQLDYQSK